MPRRRPYDIHTVQALLAPGRSVASHQELKEAGVPTSTITYRIRPDGPWQRVLPGVVAGHRGVLTPLERRLAALKYAGTGAQLTGIDALVEHGLPTARRLAGGPVHVSVPHANRRTSHGFAVLTRCRVPVDAVVRRGLACSPAAVALVEACRRLERLDDVRALTAEAVQRDLVTVPDLVAAVRRAARQRTALTRRVLVEIAAGVRSVAEGRLRTAFSARGFPMPLWNAALEDLDGELVAVLDGYWEGPGVGLELDSLAWHLAPEAYLRTQRRQRRLLVRGVPLLPVGPADVLADPDAVCREVLEFLRRHATHTPARDLVVRRRRSA